jgi:plasmid stabilization system protein ParE
VKYRIRISDRASAQIDRAAEWWRLNREKAPDAFDADTDEALERLRVNPLAGSRVRARRGDVRALWLDRIGYFLYYRVVGDIVEVLALWHASRGSRPRL